MHFHVLNDRNINKNHLVFGGLLLQLGHLSVPRVGSSVGPRHRETASSSNPAVDSIHVRRRHSRTSGRRIWVSLYVMNRVTWSISSLASSALYPLSVDVLVRREWAELLPVLCLVLFPLIIENFILLNKKRKIERMLVRVFKR